MIDGYPLNRGADAGGRGMQRRLLARALKSAAWAALGWSMSANIAVAADAGRKVVLVGASIGKAWHIEDLGPRTDLPGYSFNYLGNNEFDKSALVRQIITGKERPDLVLIKECASYFWRDTSTYRQSLMTWVGQLRAAGIRPVLVTTAPIAEPEGVIVRAKVAIKHLLGRPEVQTDLAAYNDWLRQYARQEGLPVFDLEAVLRISGDNRYLRKNYDSGDGLHLSDAAYRDMDREFASFLRSLEAGGGPRR